jgi:hypothetical protein
LALSIANLTSFEDALFFFFFLRPRLPLEYAGRETTRRSTAAAVIRLTD